MVLRYINYTGRGLLYENQTLIFLPGVLVQLDNCIKV